MTFCRISRVSRSDLASKLRMTSFSHASGLSMTESSCTRRAKRAVAGVRLALRCACECAAVC